MSAWLQTKSWEEAKEAIVKSKGVAIVPIGSDEQHSYNLLSAPFRCLDRPAVFDTSGPDARPGQS